MHHVAIIYKRSRLEAANLANELKLWLENRHIEVFCQQNIDDSAAVCRLLRDAGHPPSAAKW